MKRPIYLDCAATTPVAPQVAVKMAECLTSDGCFGNAASTAHIYGWQSAEVVDRARQQVADLLAVDIREIVFTSGATESNNLALKGAALANKAKGRHIISSSIEHKSVLDTLAYLAGQGFDISLITPNRDGVIQVGQVKELLRDDTVLVSLMHVNNELGTVTDIAAIGELTRQHGIIFHVDAAQSAGKLALDGKAMKVDLMSLSAHKMYGPKGAGVLYVSRVPQAVLQAQIHGGGHEKGLRSGTLATHQIVGMGEAAVLAKSELVTEVERVRQLRDRLWRGVADLSGLRRNGSVDKVSAGHLNICFSGVDGETLLMSLRELALSSGSACNSDSMKPSYVLTAIGLSDRDADSSLRFSVGRYTTEEEIDQAVEHIRQVYQRLQS